MEILDISNRIKELVSFSKLSVRKFAQECGLKQPTLDKQIRGIADPSIATLIGIKERFPELSLDWLVVGEGNMFKDFSNVVDVESKYADRLNKLIDTITTQQEVINMQKETNAAIQETVKAQKETIATLRARIQQLESV